MSTDNGSPLLHDVIVRRIFSYLFLSDLKTCRQVCSKWKCLSHSFLQKYRFRFRFIAFTEDEMHEDEKETEEIILFLQNFENLPPVKFFLVSSMLNGHVNLLADILDRQKNNLKFVTIHAAMDVLVPNQLCDISKAVLARNITSLTIRGGNISISMKSMSSISNIELQFCTILLPNKRIAFAAKNLKLSTVNFLKDEKIPEKIVLGDFVQLPNLKNLDLTPGFINIQKTLISLNMQSKLSLNSLRLCIYFNSVDSGWPFLNLTIKKLKLRIIKPPPCVIPNSLQLEELEFHSVLTTYNINFIPQTLKRLILNGKTKWQRSSNYQPRSLPNLNYLKIITFSYNESCSFLEHFREAIPNLLQLDVQNDCQEVVKLNVQFIPPIVEQIKLIGNVQFYGNDSIIWLKSLILEDYQLECIDNLFNYFQPTHLILISARNDINVCVDKLNKLLEENKCERIIAKWGLMSGFGEVPKYFILENGKLCDVNLQEFTQLFTP